MPRDFYVPQNSPLVGMPRLAPARRRPGIISIQSFNALLDSATSATVSINNVANAAGSVDDALIFAQRGRLSNNAPSESLVTVELTNGTTLTVRKGAASNYGYVWGFVVHFEPGVIKQKEVVNVSFGASQNKTDALSKSFITANSLILPCGVRTDDVTALTDSNTLRQVFAVTAFSSVTAGRSSEITSNRDGAGIDDVIMPVQIAEMDVL